MPESKEANAKDIARIEKCREELEKLLDKHQCTLQASFIVAQNSVTPLIKVVKR
jgi:uncharacterized protein YejL (UPF0352 family)